MYVVAGRLQDFSDSGRKDSYAGVPIVGSDAENHSPAFRIVSSVQAVTYRLGDDFKIACVMRFILGLPMDYHRVEGPCSAHMGDAAFGSVV